MGESILEGLVSATEEDEEGNPANVVDALFENGRLIAKALRLLGNADAATPLGALEAHGMAVEKAGERIGNGLESIAEALADLAAAIREQRAPA
jgi:phosphoribosylpyrophosphate synthetase